MAARAAAEAVALHDAGEALALGRAGHVDLLRLGERGDRLLVAHVVLAGILHAHLAQVAHGSRALLLEVALHGLVDLLLLDGAEAHLHGLVAVGGLRLHLADLVGLGLDDRHRDDAVVLAEDLGHADLLTVDCVDHYRLTPFTA